MKREGEARPLYQSLTENASFYGFLAADHLGQPYRMLQKETPQLNNLIPTLLNETGIQRAFELLALDMKKEARAEWFHTLKDRSTNHYLAAAKMAQDKGHHFTAILTLSRAKAWNEVGLRFPMAYENLVRRAANEQKVSPALIYGVARRESAFDPNIVSHAKAQGLMQLIPGTAKQVSRGLGIKHLSKKQTFDPQTNIRMGAAYLNTLLKRFDGNYALATASYNAGPHRMPRWRPDYQLEAARWVESIPFNETRNYVQAVMGYMTIYEYKLKGSEPMVTRLSRRLSPINP
jgi:soluble lytic murein transglycosylase